MNKLLLRLIALLLVTCLIADPATASAFATTPAGRCAGPNQLKVLESQALINTDVFFLHDYGPKVRSAANTLLRLSLRPWQQTLLRCFLPVAYLMPQDDRRERVSAALPDDFRRGSMRRWLIEWFQKHPNEPQALSVIIRAMESDRNTVLRALKRLTSDPHSGVHQTFIVSHDKQGLGSRSTQYIYKPEPGWVLWNGYNEDELAEGISSLIFKHGNLDMLDFIFQGKLPDLSTQFQLRPISHRDFAAAVLGELLVSYTSLLEGERELDPAKLVKRLKVQHLLLHLDDPEAFERGLKWLEMQGFPISRVGHLWGIYGLARERFFSMDINHWPKRQREAWLNLQGQSSARVLAQRLRLIQEVHGFSWNELRLSSSWVSDWYLEKQGVQESEIEKIAGTLGIEPAWLTYGYSRGDLELMAYAQLRRNDIRRNLTWLRRASGLSVGTLAVVVRQLLNGTGKMNHSQMYQSILKLEKGTIKLFRYGAAWPKLAEALGQSPYRLLAGEEASKALRGISHGKRLALLLKVNGFTEREFGRQLGVPQASVTGWVKDAWAPRAETQERIAALLKVDPYRYNNPTSPDSISERPSRSKPTRGFSLMELMCVMALGLIGGLTWLALHPAQVSDFLKHLITSRHALAPMLLALPPGAKVLKNSGKLPETTEPKIDSTASPALDSKLPCCSVPGSRTFEPSADRGPYSGEVAHFMNLSAEGFVHTFSAWLRAQHGRVLTSDETSSIAAFAQLLSPSQGRQPEDKHTTLYDLRDVLKQQNWAGRFLFPHLCARATEYVTALLARSGIRHFALRRTTTNWHGFSNASHDYPVAMVAGVPLIIDLVPDQFENVDNAKLHDADFHETGLITVPQALVESAPYRDRLPWYTTWRLELDETMPAAAPDASLPSKKSTRGFSLMEMMCVMAFGLIGGLSWLALHPAQVAKVLKHFMASPHALTLLSVPIVGMVIGKSDGGPAPGVLGALDGAEWKEQPSGNPDVDFYEVKMAGKRIKVLAENHPVKPEFALLSQPHPVVERAFRKAAEQGASWSVLRENRLEPNLTETWRWKFQFGATQELPSLGQAAVALYRGGRISFEDMVLALGMMMLDRQGRLPDVPTVPPRTGERSIGFAVSNVETFLNAAGLHVEEEPLYEILRPYLTLQAVPLDTAVRKYNSVLAPILEESNRMGAEIVRDALRSNSPNILIHLGRAHLPGLVTRGPIAARAAQQIANGATLRTEHVYHALHPDSAQPPVSMFFKKEEKAFVPTEELLNEEDRFNSWLRAALEALHKKPSNYQTSLTIEDVGVHMRMMYLSINAFLKFLGAPPEAYAPEDFFAAARPVFYRELADIETDEVNLGTFIHYRQIPMQVVDALAEEQGLKGLHAVLLAFIQKDYSSRPLGSFEALDTHIREDLAKENPRAWKDLTQSLLTAFPMRSAAHLIRPIKPSDASQEDALLQRGAMRSLYEVLEILTPREKEVVWGIVVEGRSRELLAWDFTVTEERIQQIFAKAMKKLRHPARKDRLRNAVPKTQVDVPLGPLFALQPKRSTRGFSLMEMMCVMALGLGGLAIAIPILHGTNLPDSMQNLSELMIRLGVFAFGLSITGAAGVLAWAYREVHSSRTNHKENRVLPAQPSLRAAA